MKRRLPLLTLALAALTGVAAGAAPNGPAAGRSPAGPAKPPAAASQAQLRNADQSIAATTTFIASRELAYDRETDPKRKAAILQQLKMLRRFLERLKRHREFGQPARATAPDAAKPGANRPAAGPRP